MSKGVAIFFFLFILTVILAWFQGLLSIESFIVLWDFLKELIPFQ